MNTGILDVLLKNINGLNLRMVEQKFQVEGYLLALKDVVAEMVKIKQQVESQVEAEKIRSTGRDKKLAENRKKRAKKSVEPTDK